MGTTQSKGSKELFDKLYPDYDIAGLTGVDLITDRNYEFVRIGKDLALVSNDLMVSLKLECGYATADGIEKLVLSGKNGDLLVKLNIYYCRSARYLGWCYYYEQLHPSGKKMFLKTKFLLKYI